MMVEGRERKEREGLKEKCWGMSGNEAEREPYEQVKKAGRSVITGSRSRVALEYYIRDVA